MANVFSNLKNSLPPLVPANLPTTDPVMDAQIQPQPVQAMQLPVRNPVFAPVPARQASPTPIEQAEQPLMQVLRSDEAKDANPYGSPGNHPGVFGKILHGLSVATGGPSRRFFQEENLGRELTPLEAEQSRGELEGAQAGNLKEETAEAPGKAQSEESLQGKQGAEAEARTNLTNKQVDLYNQAGQALKDPKITGAFTTLSDANATPEARRTAMATISQSPIAMLPMLRGEMTGAENLYREGEVGSRIGGHNLIQDPNSPTGYSTLLYDRFGNVTGSQPIEPTETNPLLLGPQAGSIIGQQTRLAGGKAAATQAQGLIPIYDPQTNDVIGYVGKGSVANASGAGARGVADAEAGGLTPKPGTTVTEQGQNAVSLQNMISKNILPAIDVAAKAGDMGPASGRVQEFLRKHVGNPDSAAAKLQAQLAAVQMMLGRMYGYRSAEYLQGMEDFLNVRMTPDSLRAYLSGVTAHAQTIAGQGGMGPKAPGATFRVPSGAPEAPREDGKVLFSDGKAIAKSEGGRWVAP